jgi:hypothetical protein
MVARWTNWPPIPPFAWQRGLAGMLLGAVPHAFEGLLGYLIDYADGDNFYSRQRSARFNKRHPGELPQCQGLLGHWPLIQASWYQAVPLAAGSSPLGLTRASVSSTMSPPGSPL